MFDFVARWFYARYSGLHSKSEYRNRIADYILTADDAFREAINPEAMHLQDAAFFRREVEKVAMRGGSLTEVLSAAKDMRKTHRLVAQMLAILYEHGFTF